MSYLNVKKWMFPIKIVLTLSLFYLIFKNVNWNEVKEVWEKADRRLLPLLIFVKLFGAFAAVLRWKILLLCQRLKVPLKKLCSYYLTGRFFSFFLPTMIGGDAYRVYKLQKLVNSFRESVFSVAADRIFGFVVLLSLGLAAVMLSWNEWNEIYTTALIVCASGLTIFLMLTFVIRLSKAQSFRLFGEKARLYLEGSSIYFQNLKIFIVYLSSVLLFYFIMVLGYEVMFAMFHVQIPVLYLLITIVLTRTAAMIPISLNGLGLLDGSFVFLISHTGVDYDVSVLVMILHRILEMGISAIGGVLYLFNNEKI